jgi:hypothetical protein
MLPLEFKTSGGHDVAPNVGQKYLWECWLDAAERIGKLDALVINGDAIDGKQDAQRGTELLIPLLNDQADAAVICIDQFSKRCGNPKKYCTQGTEYHDGKAGEIMERVAKDLDAVRYQGLGTGKYCKEVLDLDVEGVILNISHGTSIASGLYRATPPDREGVWSALAGKAGKSPKAECCVRSHAHNFVHVEHQSKHIVITPCWQLQTRYMRRHSVYRMLPDIGYVVITVDTEARKIGDDPCRVTKHIYPLPEPKIAHL